MKNQTMLQKVSEETMRFMRGKYNLDELGNGKNELKFRRGGKTAVTIYIEEESYDFVVIFGKAEREKFETQRENFSPWICSIYDTSKTYHDGKWMRIPVTNLEELEEVKKLIMIKRRPNRKPFPKENAIYSKCGMRCDLCLFYTGTTLSEQFRNELYTRYVRVYGEGEGLSYQCPGCYEKDDMQGCPQLKCASKRGQKDCVSCAEYPCEIALAVSSEIKSESILGDDVTWAILPFVHEQYGN